ncbi:unnamed protein product, partial [Meganyctiphanes norvegica]
RLGFSICFIILVDMMAFAIGQVKPVTSAQGETFYLSVPAYKLKMEDVQLSKEDMAPDNIGILASGKWFKCYKIFMTCVFQVAPGGILIGLSVSLVIGILRKKVHRTSDGGGNGAFHNTIAVLTVNVLFIMCSLPYALLTVGFKTESRCFGSAEAEKILFILNLLQICWSIVNILVFIFLNKECKKEIKSILKSIKLKCLCRTPRNDLKHIVPHIVVDNEMCIKRSASEEELRRKGSKCVSWAVSNESFAENMEHSECTLEDDFRGRAMTIS